MTTQGFEGLLESIKEDALRVHDSKMASVHTIGDSKYQSMMKEANVQLQKQKKQNQAELKHVYAKEVRQAEKLAQRDIVSIRHEYVKKVLDASLNALENMEFEPFLNLLLGVLKNENGGQRPRIHVDSKRHTQVLDAIGSDYQVIDDESIRSGFVLSYVDYDIDFEFKNIFEYRKDEFTKIALINLFEVSHES